MLAGFFLTQMMVGLIDDELQEHELRKWAFRHYGTASRSFYRWLCFRDFCKSCYHGGLPPVPLGMCQVNTPCTYVGPGEGGGGKGEGSGGAD